MPSGIGGFFAGMTNRFADDAVKAREQNRADADREYELKRGELEWAREQVEAGKADPGHMLGIMNDLAELSKGPKKKSGGLLNLKNLKGEYKTPELSFLDKMLSGELEQFNAQQNQQLPTGSPIPPGGAGQMQPPPGPGPAQGGDPEGGDPGGAESLAQQPVQPAKFGRTPLPSPNASSGRLGGVVQEGTELLQNGAKPLAGGPPPTGGFLRSEREMEQIAADQTRRGALAAARDIAAQYKYLTEVEGLEPNLARSALKMTQDPTLGFQGSSAGQNSATTHTFVDPQNSDAPPLTGRVINGVLTGLDGRPIPPNYIQWQRPPSSGSGRGGPLVTLSGGVWRPDTGEQWQTPPGLGTTEGVGRTVNAPVMQANQEWERVDRRVSAIADQLADLDDASGDMVLRAPENNPYKQEYLQKRQAIIDNGMAGMDMSYEDAQRYLYENDPEVEVTGGGQLGGGFPEAARTPAPSPAASPAAQDDIATDDDLVRVWLQQMGQGGKDNLTQFAMATGLSPNQVMTYIMEDPETLDWVLSEVMKAIQASPDRTVRGR